MSAVPAVAAVILGRRGGGGSGAGVPDDDNDDEGRDSWCIAMVSILFIIAMIFAIFKFYPLHLTSDDPELPQYSVSGAALSPNATVVNDQNLLTTDFSFTLKAYNPFKKKTFFSDNSSQAANISCRVSRFNETVIGSSSAAALIGGGPSSLPPLNSTVITLNIPVQDVALPLDNKNGTTVYDLILTMTFRGGFVEKESEYRQVWVTCYLACSFPTGFIFTSGNEDDDDRDCTANWADIA